MSGPSMSVLDLLEQGEIWQSGTAGRLQVTKIADMEIPHLINLRGWLMRNAQHLHASSVTQLYSMSAFHGDGEQAGLDLERALDRLEEETPRAWMKEQPLFKAITRRLSGHTYQKDRALTLGERAELRNMLRALGLSLDGIITELDGASVVGTVKWNAYLDSLIKRLQAMRRD